MEDAHSVKRVPMPEAPALPGLTFRRFRGESDYATMVAIREGCRKVDQIDPLSAEESIPTVEDLARWFATARSGEHAFDPALDMLFAEVSGRTIGYNRITWWTEQDGTWLYLHLGYLLPEWRLQGIGRAMLRWAEGRIRTLAVEHPTGGKGTFGANATSTQAELTSLLREEGYVPAFRMIEMELTDLEHVPRAFLPAEFTVRPARPEHYRAMWDAFKDSYRGRNIAHVPTEQEYREFLQSLDLDPALAQVAWHRDEVAGMVLCELHGACGVVAEVCVRPAWRRRGVARALLIRALDALRARSVSTSRLVVRAENETRAQDLYASVGFRPLKEHVRYRKLLG
jgi:ribosomal protein S18 acetylase RimI-like enzyme